MRYDQSIQNAVEVAGETLRAAERITLYTGVLQDPIVNTLLDWLRGVAQEREASSSLRYRFLGQLAQAATDPRIAHVTSEQPLTSWQQVFLDRILFDENPFTLAAERTPSAPSGLTALASHDLQCLHNLYLVPARLASVLDPDGVLAALTPSFAADADPLRELRTKFISEVAATDDWAGHVHAIARWIHRLGAGDFGRFAAFRWEADSVDGSRLSPIVSPDWIPLDRLIGYEDERSTVLRNTEKFLQGLPAQNVLLYGDRGTGKSATVKAVLYEYAAHGLRMVEVPRSALAAVDRVLSLLQHRAARVILFIDDLSFEEGEVAYKELKAVLEGNLAGRPENVLVYATSNRRHLIQERFSDRSPVSSDGGEVNPRDTLEEKLSLADRFGITVIFPSPDQDRFLSIVEGIAAQRGIDMPREELRKAALQWALWNNGRSARTATQFIDELESEKRFRAVVP